MTNLLYQGKCNLNDRLLKVDWKLNQSCNRNCSYCYNKEKTRYNNIFPNKQMIDTVVSYFNDIPLYYIFLLSGGEPTLYPHLHYLFEKLNYLGNKLKVIQLITNGYATVDYYNDLYNIVDCDKVLYLSIHPEYLDIKYISSICSLLDKLSSSIKIHVAFMYTCVNNNYIDFINYIINAYPNITYNVMLIKKPPNFDSIERCSYRDIFFLKQLNTVNLVYQPFYWKYNDKEEYNLDYNNALLEDKLNFRGLWCCSGTSVLEIRLDGKVFGTICNQGTTTGFSIYDVNPFIFCKKFVKPIRCFFQNCSCRDNLIIPKYRKIEKAQEYCMNFIKRL